tara:strand:- start:71 stop:772 length:702 start_codon:yes stop_codon:yes gene_type:complete
MEEKNIDKDINVFYETAHAEHASALDMLAACKQCETPKLAYGYFLHARDEYIHTKHFLKILSNRCKAITTNIARLFRYSAPSLITKGYVSRKGYLIETMKLKDFIAFVYTNELLAKESFEKILKLVDKNEEESFLIKSIMSDELTHHGMAKKHFIKHYPWLQPWHLKIYRLREIIKNKGRKLYDVNLKFLDRIMSPIYLFLAYIVGRISILINLREFSREGKNIMNISSRSII